MRRERARGGRSGDERERARASVELPRWYSLLFAEPSRESQQGMTIRTTTPHTPSRFPPPPPPTGCARSGRLPRWPTNTTAPSSAGLARPGMPCRRRWKPPRGLQPWWSTPPLPAVVAGSNTARRLIGWGRGHPRPCAAYIGCQYCHCDAKRGGGGGGSAGVRYRRLAKRQWHRRDAGVLSAWVATTPRRERHHRGRPRCCHRGRGRAERAGRQDSNGEWCAGVGSWSGMTRWSRGKCVRLRGRQHRRDYCRRWGWLGRCRRGAVQAWCWARSGGWPA